MSVRTTATHPIHRAALLAQQPTLPTGWSRRGFLAGAGAAAAGLALGLPSARAAAPVRSAGAGLAAGAELAAAQIPLPMTVVNQTDRYGNGDLRLAIVGVDTATGEQVYVDASGARRPVSSLPLGRADLSIPLSGNGDTHLGLPSMSGRMYVSVGGPIPFNVVADGNGRPALQYPAGWVESDPSWGLVHDCAEFTLIDSGMFCNTTYVDMLSIPMQIDLVGSQTQRVGRLQDGARAPVFAALRANPDFAGLVHPDNLRAIAPGHGLDAGKFSPTYLDGEIGRAWSAYTGQDLRVQVGPDTRTGRVVGDVFQFDGGVAPIRRPSTRDVLFCDGALVAPNDGLSGPVAAVLGAALNRTVLADHPDQPTTDASQYYRTPVTNHWSRILHEHSVDGRAYGFAFDDVAEHASYIQDTAPISFTLTLTPFGA